MRNDCSTIRCTLEVIVTFDVQLDGKKYQGTFKEKPIVQTEEKAQGRLDVLELDCRLVETWRPQDSVKMTAESNGNLLISQRNT